MVSGTHTRASLLERLQDGADPMAWDDFFHRYWPFVFSLARAARLHRAHGRGNGSGGDAGHLREEGRILPRSVARAFSATGLAAWCETR